MYVFSLVGVVSLLVVLCMQAVAISDSGNHCIRICQIRSETSAKFVDDKMITFGDRKVPDFVDGNSADALFSTPAGLVGCNNGLLICDSGWCILSCQKHPNISSACRESRHPLPTVCKWGMACEHCGRFSQVSRYT